MKTIEERAMEFANRHEEAELNLRGLGGVYGYDRIKNAEICAYERGAKEQQQIDDANLQERFEKVLNGQKWELIDKACEWLEEHLYEEMFNLPFNHWIELFRKAMEE